MEKDRSFKLMAVVALGVAVIGLSLGFAAFSSTLTIEPSAVVMPEDNMRIIFSNQNGAPTETTVAGVLNSAMEEAKTRLSNAGVSSSSLPNALDAVIDNTNKKAPKISNLKATFTAPGQSVTYSFYVYNEMEYKAYLKTILFDTSKYSCQPGDGTDVATANKVCQSIKVNVNVNDTATALVIGNGSVTKDEFNASSAHELSGTSAESITVTIEYPTNSPETNGDVTVRLPDVQLTYSSTED